MGGLYARGLPVSSTPCAAVCGRDRLHAMDLKQFRARVGISQQQLADAVGVTQATISRIEAGTQVPQAALYCRLEIWEKLIARQKRIPRGQRLNVGALLG